MLAERGQDVSVMLDLEVPEDELMVRLIKRGKDSGRVSEHEKLQCPQPAKAYNKKSTVQILYSGLKKITINQRLGVGIQHG